MVGSKQIESLIKVRRQAEAFRVFGTLDRWFEIPYISARENVLRDLQDESKTGRERAWR